MVRKFWGGGGDCTLRAIEEIKLNKAALQYVWECDIYEEERMELG